MPWSSWSSWGSDPSAYLIRDTLYCGVDSGAGISDLATDQSQYADSQTAAATWHYEPSPATNYRASSLQTEWTIDAGITANNTDTGRLMWHGTSPSGDVITLQIAAGAINAILGASVVGSLAMPSVSGSDQDFLVTWSTLANPDTTGSSDACLSWLYIWNLSAGTFNRARFTHAARTAISASAFIWWANSTAGANPFTGTPSLARFSLAFHTATETYEELVAASSAPTLAGEERRQVLVPPQSTAIGDDGHFAGPIAALSAAAAQANDLILAGPLVNIVCRSRITHRGDRVGDAPKTIADPVLTGAYLYLHWLACAPVPPGCNRVKVRAMIQQWRTGGDADDLDIVVYSLNRPGFAYRPATSPIALEVHRDVQTRNADDGSGATAGAIITFDNLRVARDSTNWSYFALGFRVTDAGGAGSTADQLWTVKDFRVDPIFETQADGLPAWGG